MIILVTGASGFVGSHIVEHALAAGHEVWAAMRPTSSRRWLTDRRIRFIMLGDVINSDVTFDAIVWCAGITKALHSGEFEEVNNRQMQVFVEALRANNRLPKYFLFMSSLSAHTPASAYGRSKLHAAEWIKEQRDLVPIVLYPTGVYGPRDKDYLQQFSNIRSGFDFVPSLSQEQKLTFIYVEDLAEVVLRCLSLADGIVRENGHCDAIEMDVAEPRVYSNTEFRNLILDEMSAASSSKKRKAVMVLRLPAWFVRLVCSISGFMARVCGRPSLLNSDKALILTQIDWTADTSGMQELLGYLPPTSLRDGIRLTYEWYKKNGCL